MIQTATISNNKSPKTKKLHVDNIQILPDDSIQVMFSDGYQDRFNFDAQGEELFVSPQGEQNIVYLKALLQDLQSFIFIDGTVAVWRMPYKAINIWIGKSYWADETHYSVFYNGKMQLDLQKNTVTGNSEIECSVYGTKADPSLIGAVEKFIEQIERINELANH